MAAPPPRAPRRLLHLERICRDSSARPGIGAGFQRRERRPAAGAAWRYAVAFISSRPQSIRRISEVPAPISINLASRKIRLTALSAR